MNTTEQKVKEVSELLVSILNMAKPKPAERIADLEAQLAKAEADSARWLNRLNAAGEYRRVLDRQISDRNLQIEDFKRIQRGLVKQADSEKLLAENKLAMQTEIKNVQIRELQKRLRQTRIGLAIASAIAGLLIANLYLMMR